MHHTTGLVLLIVLLWLLATVPLADAAGKTAWDYANIIYKVIQFSSDVYNFAQKGNSTNEC